MRVEMGWGEGEMVASSRSHLVGSDKRRGDGWGWPGWYLGSSSQLGFAEEPTPTLRVVAEVLVWVWVTLRSRCQCEIQCGRLFFGETPRWETMIRDLMEAAKADNPDLIWLWVKARKKDPAVASAVKTRSSKVVESPVANVPCQSFPWLSGMGLPECLWHPWSLSGSCR